MTARRALAAAFFVGLSAVFLAHLAPGWGAMALFNTWDGLEYVICAARFGIDHPPGHPTYLLIGHLFTRLPFGDPSWNMNLLSALAGASAALLLALAADAVLGVLNPGRPGENGATAAAVGLTIAFSFVFWSHSVIPEVHTLFLSAVGLCLYAVVRWRAGGPPGWLLVAAAALSAGIGVNLLGTCAAAVPVAVLAASPGRRPPRRTLATAALLLFAGFGAYLYYPIRVPLWPSVYSHPMNSIGPHEMGSPAWYAWYISGRAWTGGTMFFAGRILPNIPLYARTAARDLGPPLFALAAAGVAACAAASVRLARRAAGRPPREADVLKVFLLAQFLFTFLPAISIHDPSNPRATEYLANFFLPSFYVLALLGACGAAAALRALRARAANLPRVVPALLLAGAAFQFAMNRSACDLRGNDGAAVFSRRALEQLPDGSVIVSKLVYGMIDAFYGEVERSIPPGKVDIHDPELAARRLGGRGERDFFARRHRALLGDIERILGEGRPVYVAGDIVDEDKSPEKMLLADLALEPWLPLLAPAEAAISFPRELLLHRVTGLREAAPVSALPEGLQRGAGNDGAFANGMALAGFRPLPAGGAIRRDALPIEFFWTAAAGIEGEVYAGAIFLDARMRRFGEPVWFRVGGARGPARWDEGTVMRDDVVLLPPPLPPGRYALAVGMVDGNGDAVAYRPAAGEAAGRAFDYVLLGLFEAGAPPAAPGR
ncbi:MAG: DUF2723 domain-containing protein [bacterium]|nr:DUF2723 domain-containing protein [bacterium]